MTHPNNATYQASYKKRVRGVRLDIVVSKKTKERLALIAAHEGETQKFVLEKMIAELAYKIEAGQ